MKKQQIPRLIDSRIYRYWQALFMAFYSRRLYVDVAKRWHGFCFFYLLLVIAVASIPVSIRITLDINHYLTDDLIAPIEKIPPLQVKHGEIRFDKPMPYFIKNKAGEAVIMIDTRKVMTNLDAIYPELMVLITKNKLYFRRPDIKFFFNTPEQALHNAVVHTLDKSVSQVFVVKEWIKSSNIIRLKWFVTLMVYPVLVSFVFGLCFSLLLAFSMFAQTVSWLIFRFKIKFAEAARLLIVSSTSLFFAFFLLWAFNLLFRGVELIFLASFVLYFSYGVLAVKRESRMLVRS